jgi:hypothetical protein
MAGAKHPLFQSNSVSRTDELLSCARTAFKIATSQGIPQQYTSVDFIKTHDTNYRPQPISSFLEEGLTLLRSMDHDVKSLQTLVKRRGQTNDPTREISTLAARLEQDTQELQEFTSKRLLQQRCATKSAQQHLQFVAAWFQQMSKHQSQKLQDVMELRGTVLRDQAHRRTMVTRQTKPSSQIKGRRIAIKAATPLFDSPLFASTDSRQPPKYPNNHSKSTLQSTNHHPANDSASTEYDNYYNQSSSIGGPYYGGGAAASNVGGLGYGDVGMRNRRATSSVGNWIINGRAMSVSQQETQNEALVQQDLQQRQIQRQTAQRAREARQAERQIGELGQLFGKMSTLIATQGEVVEQIEEDVEAAHVDIVAGEKELSTLYQLKKGNRPLIIKVYAILIFLICFMRLYAK